MKIASILRRKKDPPADPRYPAWPQYAQEVITPADTVNLYLQAQYAAVLHNKTMPLWNQGLVVRFLYGNQEYRVYVLRTVQSAKRSPGTEGSVVLCVDGTFVGFVVVPDEQIGVFTASVLTDPPLLRMEILL